MVPVGTLLLADAEETLRISAQSLVSAPALHRAVVAWLSGDVGQLSLAGDGPLRTYDEVALAAVAEEANWSTNSTRLEEGLVWLSEVELQRSGMPAPVATDGVALLALGVAARRRGPLRDWHRRACAFAPDHVEPLWLRAALDEIRGDHTAGVASEVRVALAGLGLMEATEADEQAVLRRLLEGNLPSDPLHASVLLIASRRIRRAVPIALPGRAVVGDVVRLLQGVTRSLEAWTWEDSPKTKGGEARKWHVDHEYHVQNMLWTMLAPLFPDLNREEFSAKVGPIQPRVDLVIPSLRLVIEAKFIRATTPLKKVVNEIAEDASLYFAEGANYQNLVAFVWDDARRTEQHATVIEGLLKLPRVAGAVLVSRPGKMVLTPTELAAGSKTKVP